MMDWDKALAGAGLGILGDVSNYFGWKLGADVASDNLKRISETVTKLNPEFLSQSADFIKGHLKDTFTNKAGMTGQSAAIDAQKALGQSGVYASDYDAYSRMMDRAGRIGDTSSQLTALGIGMAQKQLGSALDKMGALSPLQKIAAALNLGQGIVGGLSSIIQQGLSANQRNQQIAANLIGAAQSGLNRGRATFFQNEIAPHLTDANAGLLSGALATSSSMANEIGRSGVATNALGGLSSMLGTVGGSFIKSSMEDEKQ